MSLIYASKYDFDLVRREGSAGYDLHTPVDIFLPPGCEMCVCTGIRLSLEYDEPVYTFLVPRSSAGVKKDLFIKNTVGIIDPSYRGDDDEIKVFIGRRQRAEGKLVGKRVGNGEFVNHNGDIEDINLIRHGDCQGYIFEYPTKPDRTDDFLLYKAGERFAQIIFHNYKDPDPVRVESMDYDNRGGFGSTDEEE